VDQIHVAEDRVQWRVVMNTALNLMRRIYGGNILTAERRRSLYN
jgi:hypothetical protein